MKLTNKQEQGLRIAVERYKNHEPWTCIAGYAGSYNLWANPTIFI